MSLQATAGNRAVAGLVALIPHGTFVVQRRGDRDILAEYLAALWPALANADAEELLETAAEVATKDGVEGAKDWLRDYHDAVAGLPAAIVRAGEDRERAEREAERERVRTEARLKATAEARSHIAGAGLDPRDVSAEEMEDILAAVGEKHAAETALARELSKRQTEVQSKARRSAEARISQMVAGIKDRIAKGVKAAADKAASDKWDADFKADKDALRAGVANVTKDEEVAEILMRGIEATGPSADRAVDKGYPEDKIVLATQAWVALDTRVKGRLLIGRLWSPGHGEDTIGWKQRGSQLERTRNLMCYVGRVTSNVHLHPRGGWVKKL